jgi:hypothetical protein
MKHIALGILTATIMTLTFNAPVAQARSIDPTRVVAIVEGWENDIQQVALLEDGRLQVQNVDGKVTTKKLSKAATLKLVTAARGLANIEIVETHSQVVCMMMLQPTLSDLSVPAYDWEKGTFSRSMRKILGASGCWVSDKVVPKEDYNLGPAQVLRAQLVILALATLK